jgi:hypothetical protein
MGRGGRGVRAVSDGKNDGSGLKAVYINAPTADAVRVQHPHVPDRTLW